MTPQPLLDDAQRRAPRALVEHALILLGRMHHGGAEACDPVGLGVGGGLGDHHGRVDAEPCGRPGDGLAVVATRGGDDALRSGVKGGDGVGGAPGRGG